MSCLSASLLTLVYTSLIRSCIEYSSATYFSAAPSHLKKLDIIQKIASRILTNSPQGTHSAPLQSLLGLDPLDYRRRKHISKIVDNIMSGRIHPYFQNILSTNAVTSSTLSTNASSFINRSLNNRRFSQFAPLVVQEITQPERTVTRALEPTSVGRSLDTTSSHPYYQHISTVMTTTDSTYTKVAQVGHRGSRIQDTRYSAEFLGFRVTFTVELGLELGLGYG